MIRTTKDKVGFDVGNGNQEVLQASPAACGGAQATVGIFEKQKQFVRLFHFSANQIDIRRVHAGAAYYCSRTSKSGFVCFARATVQN